MPKPDYSHLPRIRVGEDYARRDENGVLVETGWIDPEDGREHRDQEFMTGRDRIVPSNMAAMVPWDQAWK